MSNFRAYVTAWTDFVWFNFIMSWCALSLHWKRPLSWGVACWVIETRNTGFSAGTNKGSSLELVDIFWSSRIFHFFYLTTTKFCFNTVDFLLILTQTPWSVCAARVHQKHVRSYLKHSSYRLHYQLTRSLLSFVSLSSMELTLHASLNPSNHMKQARPASFPSVLQIRLLHFFTHPPLTYALNMFKPVQTQFRICEKILGHVKWGL